MASGSVSFKCEQCGSEFSRIENLKRHERSHDLVGKWACDQCDRSFSRSDVLKRHVRSHHGSTSANSGHGRPSPVARDRTVITTAEPVADSIRSLPAPDTNGLELLGYSSTLTETASIPGVPMFTNATSASFQPIPQTQLNPLPSGFMHPAPTYSNSNTGSNLDDPSIQAFMDTFFPASGNQWDNGLSWIFQDGSNDPPQEWFSFDDANTPINNTDGMIQPPVPPMPSHAPSRAATPPNDATEEDKWPSNYQPRRPYVVGTHGGLNAIFSLSINDTNIIAKWQQYRLDNQSYERVKASLTAAQMMPGMNASQFQMPDSLDTINYFLSLYFEKFYPQLPIVHLPTFSTRTGPPLLIASFICIGASMSKARGARAFSVDLVEMLRRTMAAMFEIDSTNMRSVDLIHVLLLVCFAGLWSGHQRSFELAELSRGMVINLCRRTQLLESPTDTFPVTTFGTKPEQISERWNIWVNAESRKRLGLAVYLLDTLFPSLLDVPGYTSQGEMLRTIMPADECYWQARTAGEWQVLLGAAPIPPAPFFVSCLTGLLTPKYASITPVPVKHLNPFAGLCAVSALHHHIWEFRAQLSVYQSIGVTVPFWRPNTPGQTDGMENGFEGRKTWLGQALDLWKTEYYIGDDEDPLKEAGRALFHLGHIALNVYVGDLYHAAGKYGLAKAAMALQSLEQWATTDISLEAIKHASELLKVIHFPTPGYQRYAPPLAFSAILCLWAFTKFNGPSLHAGQFDVGLFSLVATGDGSPSGETILTIGTKYLAGCKEWRIGAALALVLAKLKEQQHPNFTK